MGRFVLLLGVGLALALTAGSQEPVPPPGASVAPPVPAPDPSSPPPPPPSAAPAHYSFVPGQVVPGDIATINVAVELESVPTTQIRFLCEVRSEASMRDGSVRMVVVDAHGVPLHEARVELPAAPGINRCQFLWDTDKVPLGVFTARFSMMQSGTFDQGYCEMIVSKLSETDLGGRVAQALQAVDDLKKHLEKIGAGGRVAPYAAARASIAGDFAARAAKSLADHDWPRTHHYVDYVNETVSRVRTQLALSNVLPEQSGPLPSPRLARLEHRDGTFRAEGRPVFLAGGLGGESLVREMPRLNSYGLNLAVLDFGTAAPSSLPAVFDAAEDLNISVTYLLSPFEAVGEGSVTTGGRVLTSLGANPQDTRDAVGQYVRAAVAGVRGEPMLNGISIARQPAFDFRSSAVREGFMARLREVYPSVDALNRIWKTRFVDFDEITLVWDSSKQDYHTRPSFQFDWQSYHQWLGTDLLRWLVGAAKEGSPQVPVFVELSEDVLAPGESKLGLDRESLASLVDFTGVAASNRPSDPTYAMDYPQASLVYTLLRSFAPEKPILNTRHLILAPNDPLGPSTSAYVHSALWEGAMSGLNGSAVWEWASSAEGQGGLIDRPEALEAYVTAAMDLNRLSDVVHAFQQAPAPVAILWSLPGRVYSEGSEYLGSVRMAYEGLSFGGQALRFITEDQIAAEGLDGIQVLVIPNLAAIGDEMTEDRAFKAIAAYMEKGGVVIKTGNPIPYDARGRSRQNVLIPTLETILVRGKETATSYLDALDAAYGAGELEPVPRAISDYGYPLEGVRTRYLEIEGRPYLYVLNLRKEPVECHLYGPYQEGRDLIRGRMVQFPAQLDPLDPMLIQLKPVDPAEYLPTAKVAEPPVVPQREARTERVQGGAARR